MKPAGSLWERFKASPGLEDCPIYEMHGHWGVFGGAYLPAGETQTAVEHLDRANVRVFVFCSHQAMFAPGIGNPSNLQTARQFPDRMRAYCAVNPRYPEITERDLASFEANRDAYVGFKFHPSWHNTKLTEEGYRKAWEYADANRLIVLTHSWGGDARCGYEEVRAAAEKYGGASIIAGHSLHDRPDQAVDLVKHCRNVCLDTCAMMDDAGVLDRIVTEAGSERIVFGTDFPWFSYHYYIGAVLGASMSDEDRRNIFYSNARRLLDSLR